MKKLTAFVTFSGQLCSILYTLYTFKYCPYRLYIIFVFILAWQPVAEGQWWRKCQCIFVSCKSALKVHYIIAQRRNSLKRAILIHILVLLTMCLIICKYFNCSKISILPFLQKFTKVEIYHLDTTYVSFCAHIMCAIVCMHNSWDQAHNVSFWVLGQWPCVIFIIPPPAHSLKSCFKERQDRNNIILSYSLSEHHLCVSFFVIIFNLVLCFYQHQQTVSADTALRHSPS